MAIIPALNDLFIWGYTAWGDFANLTLYRGHRCELIVFAKTWPDKPPSAHQLDQRAAFQAAAQAWSALTPAKRENWRLAAARTSLCATGYNLWMHWHLTGDNSAIETIERQTGLDLIPP